jgi:hypothetical protein
MQIRMLYNTCIFSSPDFHQVSRPLITLILMSGFFSLPFLLRLMFSDHLIEVITAVCFSGTNKQTCDIVLPACTA